jgi:hypothetical protein
MKEDLKIGKAMDMELNTGEMEQGMMVAGRTIFDMVLFSANGSIIYRGEWKNGTQVK